jgi:hypothetical protein
VATVEENVAMTFADPSGRAHERVMANTSQVTWVRLPGGRQIRQTEYLAARIMIDGKLIDLATAPLPRSAGRGGEQHLTQARLSGLSRRKD